MEKNKRSCVTVSDASTTSGWKRKKCQVTFVYGSCKKIMRDDVDDLELRCQSRAATLKNCYCLSGTIRMDDDNDCESAAID